MLSSKTSLRRLRVGKSWETMYLVLMDFNDVVMDPSIRCWVANLGFLVEALTWLHPEQPPPAFQCGSRPINGIFIVPQLLAQAADRYLSFDDVVPSDHRALWLDVHLPEIRTQNQEAHILPWAWQLHPWVVACYNQTLLNILLQHNIPQCINNLNKQLQKPSDLQWKFWKELNAIDYVITGAKRRAENQCRKFRRGQVQWCPQITAAINKILFWKCILKQELSSKVGLTVLHTRAGKASITSVPYPGEYQVENLQAFISKVYKQFQCLECDETRHELPN